GSVKSYDSIGTTGTQLCTDTTAPFECPVSYPAGTHFLTAVATDNQGATSPAQAVAFEALPTAAPTVSWILPTPSGDDVYQTTAVTYAFTAAVNATDPDGT